MSGAQDDASWAVTLPMLDYFKELGGHVYSINADQDPMTVHDEIMAHIDDANQS